MAQERMKVPGLEAVVNAGRSLGSNGRGKDGLRGYMFAIASKQPKRFAPWLEMALQLENSEWRGQETFLSTTETMARIDKMSRDEIVMEYVIHLVVPPLDFGPPSGATDFLEAVIDAARGHGSNGRGKDGVEGYIRMLAHIGCKTFDKWVIRAMQAKSRSPKSIEELEARLGERGMDVKKLFNLAFAMKHGVMPTEEEPSRFVTELEEDLRHAHQYFNSLRHANQDFNGESPEAMPAGPDPEGHDHDDDGGTSDQQ